MKFLIIAACIGVLFCAPYVKAEKNDFEIAQPEATDATHSGGSTHHDPEPTYKPIKGVRITVKNTERQKETEKKIKKKKKEIRAAKEEIRGEKARCSFYQEIYDRMAGIQNVFDRAQYMGRHIFGCAANDVLPVVPQRSTASSVMCLRYMADIPPSLLDLADAEKISVTEKKKELKSLKDGLAALERYRDINIVFNSCDITDISHITVSQMKELLSGTELKQFADVYVEIEKEYGINAIAFCALSALESGWGTSERARHDHNYTGFGVYSDDAPGINAGSGEENLKMTAEHLAKAYIHEGDMYYHGKGIDGINRSYAKSRTWAYDIEDIGIRLMNKLQN